METKDNNQKLATGTVGSRKEQEPETTKLPTQQERLLALLQAHPELRAKLIEALDTDRFFITISFQKRLRPDDPHDLQHWWKRHQYSVNDVLPSIKCVANDYKAKDCPTAEIEGNEWH